MANPRFLALAALIPLVQASATTAGLLPPPPVGGGPADAISGTVDQVTGTVGGALPDVSDLTGALGSLTSGSAPTQSVSSGSDPAAGGQGSAGGSSSGGAGATGSGGGSATTAGGDGASASAPDTSAPTARLTVLSHLTPLAHTGRLKLRISLDEPGVVVLTGALRPAGSHRLVRLPRTLLGFRAAGALRVTIALPAAARRQLARAASARVSVQATAVDLARNQRFTTAKRTLHRHPKVAHLRHRGRRER